MAADLHIHIVEGITEADLADFNCNCIDSKWFGGFGTTRRDKMTYEEEFGPGSAHQRVTDTPNVWVGEVSWLKAGLTGDNEAFIPEVVWKISELVGEDLPVIDDTFLEKVRAIYATAKEHDHYKVAAEKDVLSFLEANKGKQIFTVSW
jgi:hypothetical protein